MCVLLQIPAAALYLPALWEAALQRRGFRKGDPCLSVCSYIPPPLAKSLEDKPFSGPTCLQWRACCGDVPGTFMETSKPASPSQPQRPAD